MAGISRQSNRNSKKSLVTGNKKKAIANQGMIDLSNDPYFVSKSESAKRLLNKYGTPKNSR